MTFASKFGALVVGLAAAGLGLGGFTAFVAISFVFKALAGASVSDCGRGSVCGRVPNGAIRV